MLSNSSFIFSELERMKNTLAMLLNKESQDPIHTLNQPSSPMQEDLNSSPSCTTSSPVYNYSYASALSIMSRNCRGFSSGLPYAEVLAETSDVLILCEHWLWPFEVHKFKNIHPNINGLAVADKRLTPECNLSRG